MPIGQLSDHPIPLLCIQVEALKKFEITKRVKAIAPKTIVTHSRNKLFPWAQNVTE